MAPMRNSTTASQGAEPGIVSILLAPKTSFIIYKLVSPFSRVVFTAALKSSMFVNFLVVVECSWVLINLATMQLHLVCSSNIFAWGKNWHNWWYNNEFSVYLSIKHKLLTFRNFALLVIFLSLMIDANVLFVRFQKAARNIT